MSTAVRSRVFKISAAAVTAAIAIGLCLFSQDDVSASIKERRVERLNAQIENVYTDEYQQMMDTEIADERDAKERTVDSIYTKVNPYGTNTTSMYVYFTTDQASTVSYTVSAEGYPDYTANAITSDEAAAAYREAAAGDADGSGNVGGTSTASQTTTVSSNDIASTEHEFLVLGLIPKVKNTITLTITDTDGNLKAQYKMVLSSGYIYRVYQYGFRRRRIGIALPADANPPTADSYLLPLRSLILAANQILIKRHSLSRRSVKRDRVLVQHQYAVDGVFGPADHIRVMRGENHLLVVAEQRLGHMRGANLIQSLARLIRHNRTRLKAQRGRNSQQVPFLGVQFAGLGLGDLRQIKMREQIADARMTF